LIVQLQSTGVEGSCYITTAVADNDGTRSKIMFVWTKRVERGQSSCLYGKESNEVKVHVCMVVKGRRRSKLMFVLFWFVSEVEEEALRGHFVDCGEIANVRIIRDPKTGMGKGFGYITFQVYISIKWSTFVLQSLPFCLPPYPAHGQEGWHVYQLLGGYGLPLSCHNKLQVSHSSDHHPLPFSLRLFLFKKN